MSYPLYVSICLLAGLFVSNVATAGLSGRVDALMQADNRKFSNQGQLEGRGDVVYADAQRGLRSGLSLALRHRDGVNESHLYQLFVEKRLPLRQFPGQQLQLSLGRLQRADGLGFYTLDGASFNLQGRRVTVNAYAGRPGRIEDFRSLTAQALYGADVHYQLPAQSGPWQGTARIGWQRIVDEQHEDRINWGWQSTARNGFPASLFQGTYLPSQKRLENVQARIQGEISKKYFARLNFETYRPYGSNLTFRERFYSHYVVDGQMTLAGELHYRARKDLGGQLRLRQMWREDQQGGYDNHGYGISVDADGRLRRGQTWHARIDRLVLDENRSSSFYLQGNASLSAKRRAIVSSATQFHQRQLSGSDRVLGLEAQLEQVLRADLYASCFVSFIYNSSLQNEYRAGVRVSYLFDDRRKLPAMGSLQ